MSDEPILPSLRTPQASEEIRHMLARALEQVARGRL
jgi:hypothetical protein